jgi:hypothetical protein
LAQPPLVYIEILEGFKFQGRELAWREERKDSGCMPGFQFWRENDENI